MRSTPVTEPATPEEVRVAAPVSVTVSPSDDAGERGYARFDPAALRTGKPIQPAGFLERYAGVAAAAIFGGLVLTAALIEKAPSDTDRLVSRLPEASDRGPSAPVAPPAARRPAASASRPAAAPKAPAGASRDLAFVTASLLNCRAIPSDDGDTVRKLTRGAEVQVLGVDPGWVSVSHQGRQCWASARFISTARPL